MVFLEARDGRRNREGMYISRYRARWSLISKVGRDGVLITSKHSFDLT
jgi:hypothetical protein